MFIWRVRLCSRPEFASNGRLPRPTGNRIVAGQNALHIAIKNGVPLLRGNRQDRSGRRTTDTGQRHYGVEIKWEFAAEIVNDLNGGSMQITTARVVTQSRPQLQHVILFGAGEVTNCGKSTHKALEVRNHRLYLRLLQHDLGYPNAIRGDCLLPWQRLASVSFKPIKYAAREVGAVVSQSQNSLSAGFLRGCCRHQSFSR